MFEIACKLTGYKLVEKQTLKSQWFLGELWKTFYLEPIVWMYNLFFCFPLPTFVITREIHCQGTDSDVTEVMACRTECFLRLRMTIKPFLVSGHHLLLVDSCHSPVESKPSWHRQCFCLCVTKWLLATTSLQKTKHSWSQETMFPCNS